MGDPRSRRSCPLPLRGLPADGGERRRTRRTAVDLTAQLSDIESQQVLRRLGRKHARSIAEYEERKQRRSLERRWLQEDNSYLEARVRELRHRTVQGRKDEAMQKAEDVMRRTSGALAPVVRRTSGTTSVPVLPLLQGPQSLTGMPSPLGAMTGGKQSAAVRSLKDLQRELKGFDLRADGSPTSRADADTALVLPFLEGGPTQRWPDTAEGFHPSRNSSLLCALAAGVAFRS